MRLEIRAIKNGLKQRIILDIFCLFGKIIKELLWGGIKVIKIKGNENYELEYEAVKALIDAQNKREKLSISQLCHRTGIMDNYTMQSIIANLEFKGDVISDEDRKMYRSDEGADRLTLYSLPLPVQQ